MFPERRAEPFRFAGRFRKLGDDPGDIDRLSIRQRGFLDHVPRAVVRILVDIRRRVDPTAWNRSLFQYLQHVLQVVLGGPFGDRLVEHLVLLRTAVVAGELRVFA